MSWQRKAPKEVGWYWFRTGTHHGYRIIHFCWPGRVKVLTDPTASPGTPSTAQELFDEYPHAAIHYPALEMPE